MYRQEQNRAHILGLQKDLRMLCAQTGDPQPSISGRYDAATREAIRRFQLRHHLPVTGKTDLSTWDHIVHEANQMRSRIALPLAVRIFPHTGLTIRLGDSGRFIYLLQAMLNSLRTQFPALLPLSYTGIYDHATELVVFALQHAAALPETGRLNAQTWRVLAQLYTHAAICAADIPDEPMHYVQTAAHTDVSHETNPIARALQKA